MHLTEIVKYYIYQYILYLSSVNYMFPPIPGMVSYESDKYNIIIIIKYDIIISKTIVRGC